MATKPPTRWKYDQIGPLVDSNIFNDIIRTLQRFSPNRSMMSSETKNLLISANVIPGLINQSLWKLGGVLPKYSSYMIIWYFTVCMVPWYFLPCGPLFGAASSAVSFGALGSPLRRRSQCLCPEAPCQGQEKTDQTWRFWIGMAFHLSYP